MKTAVRAVFVLAAVFFGVNAYAVTGKTHCYSGGGHTNCAGSARDAGEAWIVQQSGGRPLYPESQGYTQVNSNCGEPLYEWAGWNDGGHLNSPPASITSGGRWYRNVCGKPVAPGPAPGQYSSGTANAGYVVQTRECTADEIVDAQGFCAIPPPPQVDCAREAGKEVLGKLSVPGAVVCAGVGQLIDPDKPMSPENFVSGGCSAEAVPGGSVIQAIGSPAGQPSVLSRLRFTGEPCSSTPEILPPSEPDDYPDTVCLTGASGTAACLSTKMPKNCGTFNGQQVCVDDVPSGNCTFASGGNWVCDSSASTPPKPAAAPEFSQSGRGPTGQPSTVQVFPPGAEGGDSGSTYTGGGGAVQVEGGACGGEGQPACKIDEEGTPEFNAEELGDPVKALEDHVGTLEGLSGDEAGSVDSTGELRGSIDSALPRSGDCGPMVLSFGPTSVEIDGASKFAFIRQALGWIFGLLAALTVFSIIVR